MFSNIFEESEQKAHGEVEEPGELKERLRESEIRSQDGELLRFHTQPVGQMAANSDSCCLYFPGY